MVENSPYKVLLDEDKDFRRWFDNVKRGSVSTAEEWLRRIGYACKKFDTTPKRVAKMPPKKAGNFLLDIVSTLESEGKAGSYIENYVKAFKSWLNFNGTEVTQRIKIANKNRSVKYADERTPLPDELKRIFDMSDFRARTANSLVSLTGVRLEVLGDYLGKDGLQVRDLPEMKIEDKTVVFEKVPATVVVRDSLSKAGHQYFTFLHAQGCEYIRNLLEWRILTGEIITGRSPIITPTHVKVGSHIRTINIGDLMRKPIRAAGFGWRPYVLRRYFDTRMMLAEADGLIIRDWRVFWMGHKGDIEHTYTLNKRLPEDVIERMREAYNKAAEKYLVTERKADVNKEMVKATFNAQFLEMGGFSKEEIEGIKNLAELSTAEIKEMIRDRQKRDMGLNGNSQKIVPMDELEGHITDGWEYVRDLPNGKAIVKLPK